MPTLTSQIGLFLAQYYSGAILLLSPVDVGGALFGSSSMYIHEDVSFNNRFSIKEWSVRFE